MTTKFEIIRLKSLATLGNVEAMYTLEANFKTIISRTV